MYLLGTATSYIIYPPRKYQLFAALGCSIGDVCFEKLSEMTSLTELESQEGLQHRIGQLSRKSVKRTLKEGES